MRKKTNGSVPAVGGSSLLVIFAVLCLMVFALLGMSSVRAEQRLSGRFSESVSEYYRADCAAEKAVALLRAGTPDGSLRETGNGTWAGSFAISDAQRLAVEVRLNGTEAEILRWQEVSADDWVADDGLSVWDGE